MADPHWRKVSPFTSLALAPVFFEGFALKECPVSTNKPTPPAKSAKSKVSTIALAVPNITPPEEWQQKTKFGYMGFDDTPAGRLVRLADLVRWLMKVRKLPRIAAIELICNFLTPTALPWIYFIQPGGFAIPVDLQNPYIQFLGGSGDVNNRFINFYTQEIKRVWGDVHKSDSVLDSNVYPCAYISCTIEKANSHFGYGKNNNSTDQKNIQSIDDWTGERLEKQQAVLKIQHKNYTKKLEEMSGIPSREITRRIKEFKDKNAGTRPATRSLWGDLGAKKTGTDKK